MEATDEDEDEIRYKLLGEEDVLKYFYINPETGAISVSTPLTSSEDRQLQVRYIRVIVYVKRSSRVQGCVLHGEAFL